MNRNFLVVVLVVLAAFSGCQCGPTGPGPDPVEETDAGTPKRDSGVVILPPDITPPQWPGIWASEPCPSAAFAGLDAGSPDAGVFTLGLCISLHTLTADAYLDDQPETKPVLVQFLAGGYQSELERTPDARGVLQVKVMRARYDILKHQPGGVWPNFKGFIEHGFTDMTVDQNRSFRATSHLLRGAVRFGGLPFTPNTFPQDVWFDAYGVPSWQQSMVTSSGGSYELRLLEGTMGLYLSSPAVSLFGTELTKFPVTPTLNVVFDHDQEFDVDIPASVLEANLTIDGEPLPDVRPGPDFSITYTRPGDADATITSHHEGGLSNLTALIPKGRYGTSFSFDGVANRHFPSRIYGKPLQSSVDLTNDTTFSADFPTRAIEGSIVIDGQPARPNPAYNFQLYMFGIAGASNSSSFLMYEVPLDSASFNIKAFPGNYFTFLSLDDGLSENLATGWWVVDRYYQLQSNRSMPIALDTSTFHGKLTIDGQPPPAGQRLGRFSFRNRAMTGQYSWFMKDVVPTADGTFDVKLPKGEYEVYFTIDPVTFPTYGSGRHLMLSRVPLDQDAVIEMNYETIEITGPLRVAGEVVPDTLPGPEVGLVLQRQQDFQNFTWNFVGGDTYSVRVPRGSYTIDFIIHENAFDGVAHGNAPLGLKLNVAGEGEPFMNFLH
ncbi:MAG: hypothetical protein U0228_04455 [Myxococcaceae bacterium]